MLPSGFFDSAELYLKHNPLIFNGMMTEEFNPIPSPPVFSPITTAVPLHFAAAVSSSAAEAVLCDVRIYTSREFGDFPI